ncbi:MAG: hypothetical protein INR73_16600 [Williamsia sp.]|nr:hypothetical protein [Williamsia sp.]
MNLIKNASADRPTGIWNEPQPSNTQKTKGFQLLLFIGTALYVLLTTGCDKDKKDNINFNRARNKKWQNISAKPDPVWINPVNEKSYSELILFYQEAFPCVLDDYAIYYPDGTTVSFNGTNRCDPAQPEKNPTGTYTFDKATDSLILTVPLEVPGLPPTINVIRSKVLELTNDKMVLRFKQVLPISNTLHTITYTYKAIP